MAGRSNIPLAEANGLGVLAVDVERLRLAWERKYGSIELGAHVGRVDGDALGVGQRRETVVGEDCHEEVKGVLAVGVDIAVAITVTVVALVIVRAAVIVIVALRDRLDLVAAHDSHLAREGVLLGVRDVVLLVAALVGVEGADVVDFEL